MLGKWYPVIAMIVIDLGFAISNILLKKIASDGIDRLVFITYRQSVSAIFLFPLAYLFERASVTQYLFLLGLEYTSATFSCAFLNLVPVLTFIMALPFGLETVSIKCSSGRGKVAGALVCVGGAIVLSVYKGKGLFELGKGVAVAGESMEMKSRWGVGSVALFAGTICWSSWFLLQTHIGKRYPCQYSTTALMAFFSAIQAAIFSSSIRRDLSIWILKDKSDIFIVLYAGMIGSGLCFVGMSWCVKRRGPVFTAAFSPLVQIMAAMYDVPVLHEQLHLGSVIGSVIVIAGLYILLWGKDREMHMNNQEKLVEGSEEMMKEQVIKIAVESEVHPSFRQT
ncbi:hypothetical protein C2S53_014532 [Perilla frutescens var. hirtella]|uniref:WAT1-related protein n=1 Tax=Perilla frutescens var. hirtella TaxID=608512 RepID=A0AAD4JCL7_PERFH|nr:hypothetical protein C2S53_014532 [Perilla frutescens var. hirtella]